MSRIRTIKPDFFRHEGLQDLEIEFPGSFCMLTFAGLWTLCDKNGHFEYKPRTIKLDILPFIQFDISITLKHLENAGLIQIYKIGEKEFGEIVNFRKHQRIIGKEAVEPAKFPDYQDDILRETLENQSGNIGETSGKHPVVQGREREGEKEREKEGSGVREGKQKFHTHTPSQKFLNSIEEIQAALNDETQKILIKDFGFNSIALSAFTEKWIKKKQFSGDWRKYTIETLKSFFIQDACKEITPAKSKQPEGILS